MKLNSLNIQNFMMLNHISVDLDTPVAFFAAKNEQGKSCVQEAVRFCLQSEAVRVDLKKEYPAMVREGAKKGSVSVVVDGEEVTRDVATGKLTAGAEPDLLILPFVLDAGKFSTFKDNERRSFLFNLMGVGMKPVDIQERMVKRGCDAEKVEAVLPMLRSGFDAAAKEAGEKAKTARADWKATTGEAYGEKKADDWKAAKPEVSANEKAALTEDLQATEQDISEAQQKRGQYHAAISATETRTEKTADLKAKAEGKANADDLVKRAEKELADYDVKLNALRDKLAAAVELAKPTTYLCPCCDAELTWHNGALLAYSSLAGDKTPISAEELTELRTSVQNHESNRKTLVNQLADRKKRLREAEDAETALAALEADEAVPAGTDDLQLIDNRIADLKAQERTISARLTEIIEDERKAADADRKTVAAAAHHQAAQEWADIVDALSPDGIPGQLLAEAMAPFNARLRETAQATGWAQVMVTPDMQITANGRPYRLNSESARWRIDAALTEAISHISGLRLMLLDRVDVLDVPNRIALHRWLKTIMPEYDSIVCAMTAKEPPSGMGDGFRVFWMERGEIVTAEQKAA